MLLLSQVVVLEPMTWVVDTVHVVMIDAIVAAGLARRTWRRLSGHADRGHVVDDRPLEAHHLGDLGQVRPLNLDVPLRYLAVVKPDTGPAHWNPRTSANLVFNVRGGYLVSCRRLSTSTHTIVLLAILEAEEVMGHVDSLVVRPLDQ